MLELINLSYDFNEKSVLNEVNFKLEDGQHLSIIGPNGAGKSTLLKCLLRLHESGRQQGSISINGQDIRQYKQRELAQKVSYVPQLGGWTPPYSVRDFIKLSRYPYAAFGQGWSAADEAALERALALTSMQAFAERELRQLSGGERQKAYLAAALAQDSQIMLLDEPTAFLDPKHNAELNALLKKLNNETGLTMLTVTHDLNQPLLLGGKVLVLSRSKQLFYGPVNSLMQGHILEDAYQHEFSRFTHPQSGRPLILPAALPEDFSERLPDTSLADSIAADSKTISRDRLLAASPTRAEASPPEEAATQKVKHRLNKPSSTAQQLTSSAKAAQKLPHAAVPPSSLKLTLFIAICSILSLLSAFGGMSIIDPVNILQAGHPDAEVFWRMRLPRTVAAFLSGAGLAVCGMVFQAMFRNPLATPFTLGVSSGAALGAALYLSFGAALAFLGSFGVLGAAMAGSFLSMFLVYTLTRAKGGFSTPVMLLAGVIINFFFSSLVLFIQYISNAQDSLRIIHWLMGSLSGIELARLADLAFAVLAGSILLYSLSQELDLLMAGEELAASRGLSLKRTKIRLFAISSFMVAAVVSLAGPIGFVGMIIPHICRMYLGWTHRRLLAASFFMGGCFLCLCDLLSRVLLAPAEMPVGIVTALIGGPFFLWALFRSSRERSMF